MADTATIEQELKPVFKASHRFARMSPSKVRLDMDLVRGLGVERALEVLQFSRRRGAKLIYKVLRSAIANAEAKIDDGGLEIDLTDLVLADARVDDGPKYRRWRPRARGAAFPIYRRSCHISIGLEPGEKDESDKGKKGRTKGKRKKS